MPSSEPTVKTFTSIPGRWGKARTIAKSPSPSWGRARGSSRPRTPPCRRGRRRGGSLASESRSASGRKRAATPVPCTWTSTRRTMFERRRRRRREAGNRGGISKCSAGARPALMESYESDWRRETVTSTNQKGGRQVAFYFRCSAIGRAFRAPPQAVSRHTSTYTTTHSKCRVVCIPTRNGF